MPAVVAGGEAGRTLRDIHMYTASFQPGHSLCDFTEQAAALPKPILARFWLPASR
jgi:hypothetical protein